MSSIYSAASEVSASASKEPGCELSPSARSSHSPAASSPSTGPMSPVTTISEPSRQNDLFGTVSPSMSSAAASPAKTYQAQDRGPELLAKGLGYGERCLDLCATFDQSTQSLKMLQGCFLEKMGDGLTGFSQTWPRQGSIWNGNVYRHPQSALRTSEIEYTVLPTPTKMDGYAYSLKQTLRSKETWETISGLTGLVVARVLGLTGKQKQKKKYLVNPLLLEKMMGFPVGWTEIQVSGMPSSPKSPKSSDE